MPEGADPSVSNLEELVAAQEEGRDSSSGRAGPLRRIVAAERDSSSDFAVRRGLEWEEPCIWAVGKTAFAEYFMDLKKSAPAEVAQLTEAEGLEWA